MADELYGLTKADVDVLRQVVASWRNGTLTPPNTQGRRPLQPRTHHYAALAPAGGVSAYAAGVAGNADVTLVTVSTSGLLASTTTTVRAYNLSTAAVTANAVIQVKREELTGRFLIDFEACT